MPPVRLSLERDVRALSKVAGRVLGLLAVSDTSPCPMRYQEVTRMVSEIRQMWMDHMIRQSRVSAMILSQDSHFAAVVAAFERDGACLSKQLESISLAGWPRSPQAGLNSIRLRVTETLILMMNQIERERIAVLPLLRRSYSRVAEPVVRHSHSVNFSIANAG